MGNVQLTHEELEAMLDRAAKRGALAHNRSRIHAGAAGGDKQPDRANRRRHQRHRKFFWNPVHTGRTEMTKAAIYDPATGRITRTVTVGRESDLALNIQEGEVYVVADASPDRHYIRDGTVIEYPPKPAPWATFDFAAQQWVDARSDDLLFAELRAERNRRLAASDWTQVPDAPVDQAAWALYRQALRDLPSTTTDPRNPDWPKPPV